MKTKSFFAGLLALILLSETPLVMAAPSDGVGKAKKTAVAKVSTYTVDTQQSTIAWNAKKVGGEHNGALKFAKGDVMVDGNKLTGGSFVVDMTTMTDAGNSERLMNHLRSDDFFGIEKNPTATFKITKATPIAGAKAGEANYTVTGDLMIKGTTKPLTFPAVVKISGNTVDASAKLQVNRLDYDIKYRAAIIGTAADKVIEDTFTLDLKVVAGKTNS